MKKYTIKSIIESWFTILFGLSIIFISCIGLLWDFEYQSSWEITNWVVVWYKSVEINVRRQWLKTSFLPIIEWACKWVQFKESINDPKSSSSEIKYWEVYTVYCKVKPHWIFVDDIESVNNHKFSLFFLPIGIIVVLLGWMIRKSDVSNR